VSTRETAAPLSDDRDPIDLLAESFIARFRAGERPSIDEYVAKYPELADDIRSLLPALVELELNHSPDGTATGPVQSQIGESSGSAPKILGDYLILREIGRGGMGVVYEAVQQSLGRHVALKVLPQQSLAGSSHLERFQLEARAAARLHHTNIVPVFGVGSQEGVHYYAMQFIQGQGLDEVFEELRRLKGNPPANTGPAKSQTAAARSLSYATTRGLLTGRFDSSKADALADAQIVTTAADGLATTQADQTAPAPFSSRSGVSGRSGISAHVELSGTQAETQYYRSVARVGMQVAEGLAHAHSQGILHRDIKPSNLLLDAKGTVWITDFGLAKAEGTDALTHTGDIVGTLRYMAPERFDGWSDPRSDVYSMGVTLYELATLQYLFQEPNRAKLVESVMHVAPASPRKLDKKVPRDLETIILKAIAKEPAERYATAEQMAEDLRRFLADKPVLARRASPTEQAWRWCRRNPALATTSALAIAGLMAAVVVLAISNARIGRTNQALAVALSEKDLALEATRKSEILAKANASEALGQRARAEAGEAQARAAVDEFLSRVTEDQLLKAPGSQALRRELLQSALRFYDEFLKQHRDDPGLISALASVYLRVGNIHADLGEARESRKSFQAARVLYDRLRSANPEDRAILAGVANCQFRLGDYLPAIEIWEKLCQAEPASTRFRRDLADAFNSLAIQQGTQKKLEDELKSHQKALALREELVRDDPENLEHKLALGGTLNNLGVLLVQKGHPVDGLGMYLRAVELEEPAFAKAPFDVLCARYLGVSYQNVARTQAALGREQEAERSFKKSVEHARRVVGDHPSVPSLRAALYQAHESLARFLVKQGKTPESAEAFRQAARVLEEMPRRTPGDWYNLACLQAKVAAGTGENEAELTAEARAERNRLIAAAMSALARSIDGGSETAEHIRTDPDLEILHGRADFQALVAQRKAAEAATSLAKSAESASPEAKLMIQQEVLEARAKLAKDQPQSAQHRADLAATQYAVGQILGDLDRFDEARKTLKEALAVRTELAQESPVRLRSRLDVGWTHLALGTVDWRAFQLASADREWKAGLSAMEAALRDEAADSSLWTDLEKAWIDVADKLVQIGLWDDAHELLDRAFKRNPGSLSERDGHLWYILAMLKLRAGDQAAYHAVCGQFFEHFKNNDRKFNLYRACWLGAGALDDIKVLIPFVDADLDRNANDDWSNLHAAMIHLRAGDLARSQEIMKRRPAMWDGWVNAPFRAMIELRSGHTDLATRSIDQYLKQQDDEMLAKIEDAKNPRSVWWFDAVLMRDTIRREVQTRQDGKPGVSPPLVEIYRGGALARMGRDDQAEKAFADARAARPDDPRVLLAYSRVVADIGADSRDDKRRSRSVELIDRAIAAHADQPALLRARAAMHAQLGQWDKSKADLDSFFKAQATPHPPWFVAGTWVVGPYPYNSNELQAEIDRSLPPETNPDPERAVIGPDGTTSLAWKPAIPRSDGQLDLTPFLQSVEKSSVYVLTSVYAPQDQFAVALVANDDWLRLWCNGSLVRAQPLLFHPLMPVPIRLRAGWNTLLAKVVNSAAAASLTLKLSVNPEEITREFVALADKKTWTPELATLLETLYRVVPDRHGVLDSSAEGLAAEVAKRDAVFNRVIASRPRDSLLLQERGRYLAWIGNWDESLRAYDAMIHDHTDPEDAFVEYAAILVLKGDLAAFRTWAARLSEKFAQTKGPFVGTMLARAFGLSSESRIDAASLLKWSEQAIAKQPRAPSSLHSMALALLRGGRLEEAIVKFQESIDVGDDSARNWYGLALANIQLGRFDSASQWLDKAESWVDQKEAEYADRTAHPSPPIYITEWLETLVLRREAQSLLSHRKFGNVVLIDRSAPAGHQFRLPLGTVDLRRDWTSSTNRGSMTLLVPFRPKSPFANGKIGPDEYGPPLEIDFRGDVNPGRVLKGFRPVADSRDLSAELFLAYTKTDLFIAIRVRDDKLVASPSSVITHGDSVEIYVDGDRQPNDFSAESNPVKSNHEGFQLGTDITRRRYANGVAFKDFAVTSSKCEGGYVIEYRIPLETIDTDDGAEVDFPGPGSTLKFNLGINDSDDVAEKPGRYAILWGNDQSTSPFHQGENAWAVDLHLTHPVKYELVAGPPGSKFDSETGVFTWDTPVEPQTANITIRVQDAEKPELSAEASFKITTTAK
jgi:serine/threonine protein kinase/Flp pilus assembly protein TadD